MIQTPRQALDFVRKHGIVTMTASPRPSLVEAVAGGPIRGSWWGHSKGKLIYRLAESIHESREILALKLIDGKVSFVHRSLWPALARVVTDPDRRTSEMSNLGAEARRLLQEVDRRGTVRLDSSSKAAKTQLEKSLLVQSGSVHTEKGSHATELTSWRRVFDSDTRVRARRLTIPEALELLGLAAVP